MLYLVFRFIVLFVAISVIRSVVTAVVRAFRGGERPRSPAPSGDPGPSGATALHQDPVCGTYVATAGSFRKISGGKVVHFCSEECRDRYQG